MDSITTTTYAIHFNNVAYTMLNKHLEESNYSKVFIIVDENTHNYCLAQFMASIHVDCPFEIIEIEAGELHKTITTCTHVWEAMSELDGDRKSLVINLGGGVITDLGGFVASAFKRGIAFINVPTTLLAMVDASVGGKTGVDLGMLKNQIGVINQPKMVLIIPEFLATLDERQRNSGFAEMLKHGLIADAAYWEQLKNLQSFAEIKGAISYSIRIKNKVVQQDPTEQNIRKVLNFGHTLGHAIESYFLDHPEYKMLLHGEAIAAGMVLEGFLSEQLTGLSTEHRDTIKTTFLKRFGKLNFLDSDIEAILELLKFDKKNSHGNINFVLLKTLGEAIYDIQVPANLLNASFAYYKE